jgi:hypothetical protein
MLAVALMPRVRTRALWEKGGSLGNSGRAYITKLQNKLHDEESNAYRHACPHQQNRRLHNNQQHLVMLPFHPMHRSISSTALIFGPLPTYPAPSCGNPCCCTPVTTLLSTSVRHFTILFENQIALDPEHFNTSQTAYNNCSTS